MTADVHTGRILVARRYNASGAAIAAEFVVNQVTTGNQTAPSVSSSTAGCRPSTECRRGAWACRGGPEPAII